MAAFVVGENGDLVAGRQFADPLVGGPCLADVFPVACGRD